MIKDLERYIEVENITKYLESRDKAVYSLMQRASEISEVNGENIDEAVQLSGELSVECRDVEEVRKEATGPILKFKQRIDGMFQGFVARVSEARTSIDTKIIKYRRQEDEKRKIAEIQVKKETGCDVVLDSPGKTMTSGDSSITFRQKYRVEITNVVALCRAIVKKEIPERYVEIKISKLEKYISDTGVTALPGCVVTREDTITHRKAQEKLSQDIVSLEVGGN